MTKKWHNFLYTKSDLREFHSKCTCTNAVKKNNVRFVRKNKRWRGRIRHAPHVQKNRDVCVAYKKETKVTYPVARYDMGLPYKKKHLYQSRIPRNRITSIKNKKNTRKSIKDNNSTKTAKLTRTNQIPTHSSMHILQKSRPALNLHKK